MKATPNLNAERFRLKTGPRPSSRFDGNNGFFIVPFGDHHLQVLISDGLGWDHASVTVRSSSGRTLPICPTWAEMDHVKRLFWRDDETVMQLHVPRTQHISEHDYCLHLWRPQSGAEIPLPPSIMVSGSLQDVERTLAAVDAGGAR